MHHDDDAHLIPVDPKDIYALTRPDDKLLTLFFIYSLAATVAFPLALIPLYFRFHTLRYRFDEEGVAVSYGILWRKETYLTYSRIQDIHVTRNLFERWLGLGTVQIQTAAGSSSAEESITGIRNYNEVRNFLYAHMRGHAKPPAAPAVQAPEAETAILVGIRDELRAVRQIVEERSHV